MTGDEFLTYLIVKVLEYVLGVQMTLYGGINV